MEQLFSDYAKLDAEFKELEFKKSALKTAILEKMKENKLEKAESLYGKFTIAERISWIYSAKIKKLEESLKLAKVKEEQRGKAEAKKTEFLVFTAPKL